MPRARPHRAPAADAARTSAWRVCAAELCGSALLVLLSCAPAAASPTHRALAAGFVVTLLVQSLDHISGAYFNPTVLLAAVVWGREGWRRAGAVLAAQLAGAALGAAAFLALRPAAPAPAPTCVTRPAAHLALYQAVWLEAVCGGCVSLANCGAWDARTSARKDSWPLRIGVAVAALSLVAGELTGASMNPARSFGPALCSGDWTHHWVYWVGPLSGSLVATLGYVWLWRECPSAAGPSAGHCPRAGPGHCPSPAPLTQPDANPC